ncbi:sigma-70 family RNA polymerase sigma factor [Streptomyces chartreusis]|uniref:sigma-70 family RNA polymerase sigma factor n=1 Tax=Streptomyces chartreusis TaxID=1969 RepID=UPI00371B3AB0
MTTDIEAGTPAALYAALMAAAGPQRVLTPVALRGLLVGVARAVLVEVLGRVAAEGVTLPPAAMAAVGLQISSAPPIGTNHSTPTESSGYTLGKHPLPERAEREAPGPRFTIELYPDSRLDYSALTIRALRTNPPSPLPPVRVDDPSEMAVEHAATPASSPPSSPRPAPASDSTDDTPPQQPLFDPLKHYRKEIGKFPLLSRQREAKLAQTIEAGVLALARLGTDGRKIAPRLRRELQQVALLGERAFTEFAESNLRLVTSIAARYTGRGVDFMDLIQEGNLGMIHAIEMFDHRKGFKFSTYAVQWIRQAITRAIADQSRTIRIPVQAHDALAALRRAAKELGHNEPSEELAAVADRVGIPVDAARNHLSRERRTFPLDDLAEAIGDDALHEEADRSARGPHWTEPDTDYLGLSPEAVHSLLDRLKERERRVLTLRHGLDGGPELTLEAIGRKLGVTRERVRQIEGQAEAALLDLIHRHQNPPVVAESPPPDLPEPPPSSCTDIPRVHRKVHATGQIMVARQTISVGTQFAGKEVTVVLEDEWFRVLYEGHQIAASLRRHRTGVGKIYGARDSEDAVGPH